MHPARQELVGGLVRGRFIVHHRAREQFGLAFIWSEQVKVVEQSIGQRPGRRGIENHPHTVAGGQFRRRLDSFQRSFQLEEQDGGGAKRISGLRHVSREQFGIRSRSNGDAVLTVPGNEDQRHARRAGGVSKNVVHVDSLGNESGHGFFSKDVPADAGDERHRAARARGAHGLVGAFAAGGAGKFTAENGFAGFGDTVHFDDHVGIGTAEDENGVVRHKRIGVLR